MAGPGDSLLRVCPNPEPATRAGCIPCESKAQSERRRHGLAGGFNAQRVPKPDTASAQKGRTSQVERSRETVRGRTGGGSTSPGRP